MWVEMVKNQPLPANEAGSETTDIRSLCEKHGRYVLGLLMHLMGPGVDVEDMAQEVFLTAMQQLTRQKVVSSPRAWLGSIAVRLAANARRTKWFSSVVLMQSVPETESEGYAPDRALEEQQNFEQLYRLLGRLTEKKRTVFLLHELQEMTCAEIATLLGVPLATVISRLRHARIEFAHHISRELGE